MGTTIFDVLLLVCALHAAPCTAENSTLGVIHGTFQARVEQKTPCADFLAEELKAINEEFGELSGGIAVRYLCISRDARRRAL